MNDTPVSEDQRSDAPNTSSDAPKTPSSSGQSKMEEFARKIQNALPDKLFPDTIKMDGEKAWKVSLGIVIADEILRMMCTSKFLVLLMGAGALAGIYVGLLGVKRLPEKPAPKVLWILWITIVFCAINLLSVPSLWNALSALEAGIKAAGSFHF